MAIGKVTSYFNMNLDHSISEIERNNKESNWWENNAHLQNKTYREQEKKIKEEKILGFFKFYFMISKSKPLSIFKALFGELFFLARKNCSIYLYLGT